MKYDLSSRRNSMTITFLVVSFIIIGIIYVFMPKRLSRYEIYMTWCVVTLVTLVTDLVIGDLFDMYDLMDKAGPQASDLFIQITLPASFGILLMNFMPKETTKFIKYLILWVAISVLYEQLCRYFGYITYKGWKVWYSIIFYTFACLFMRWNFYFMREANIKNKNSKNQGKK